MNLRGKIQSVLLSAVFGLLFFVQLVTGQTTAGEFEKLADEQRNAKKYDEAVRLYSECLRLEPKNTGCLTQRAWIYVNQLKKYELAIADYNELISLFPETKSYLYYLTQFRYNRGFAYEETGNLDAAFKDYSEAVRLSPNDFKAYFGLASVSYKKGDHKAALDQANRSLDTIPGPQWNVLRGKIQKALNNKTAAEAAFREALKQDPNNREAQKEIAALNGQTVTTKTSFPNIPESLKQYESAYRAKLEYAKTQKDATGYRATALRDYFVALGVPWDMNNDEKAKFIAKWFMEMVEIDPKAAYNGFLDTYYVQNNKELLAKVEALLPAAQLAALKQQKTLPKIANLPAVYDYYNVDTYFAGSWTMDIYPVGNPSIKNVEIRITKKADGIYTIQMFPGTGDERNAELVKRITAPSSASLTTEISFSLSNRQFTGTIAGYQIQGTTSDGGKWNASKSMTLDYYYYGLEEFNAKRNETALAYFSKAIEMDSSYAKFFNSRGMTYRSLDQLDPAIADFTKAIALNYNYAHAYLNRGFTYVLKGDQKAALADFAQAINLDPKDALAYALRGRAYAALGNKEAAIADFKKALELNPNETAAKDGLARLTTAATGSSSETAQAAFKLGSEQLTAKNYEAAIRSFSECLRLDPNEKLCYAGRGDAYQDTKNYDAAIADYTQFIKLAPNVAAIYNRRATSYADKGFASVQATLGNNPNVKFDRESIVLAIADLNASLKLNPNDSLVKKTLDSLTKLLEENKNRL